MNEKNPSGNPVVTESQPIIKENEHDDNSKPEEMNIGDVKDTSPKPPKFVFAMVPLIISCVLTLTTAIIATVAFVKFSGEKDKIEKYLSSPNDISGCLIDDVFYDKINCIRHQLYPTMKCYSNTMRTHQVSCSGRHADHFRNTWIGLFDEEFAHLFILFFLTAYEAFQTIHTPLDVINPKFPCFASVYLLVKIGVWIWGTILGAYKILKNFDVNHYEWKTKVLDSFLNYFDDDIDKKVHLTKIWLIIYGVSTFFTLAYFGLLIASRKI